MNRFLRVVLFLILLSQSLVAQMAQVTVEKILNAPSKTIYDLFVDKHNFLWIASEVGVHRYDGISFTLFFSEEQSSLGASGLMQDNQGKIWFHNFTGQIFYIDNGKTHLLTSYRSEKESKFPRIALQKGLLFATSDHGLFVCNTASLESRYLTCKDVTATGTAALSVTTDRVVALGAKNWFSFRPGLDSSLVRLKYQSDVIPEHQVSSLHPNTNRDTVYFFSNPSGTLKKLGIRNDSVIVYNKHIYSNFINTISLTQNDVWVNTHKESSESKANRYIKGHNISDVAIDQEGNIWFSSLIDGLLVSYKQQSREKIILPFPDHGDVVKTLMRHRGSLLLGTQGGKLYRYDYKLKRFVGKNQLPCNLPSINKIAPFKGDIILLGTAIHTYKFHLKTRQLEQIPSLNILKQTDYGQNLTFATSASHLVILLDSRSDSLIKYVGSQFGGILQYDKFTNSFIYGKRCDAIAYDPDKKALFIAFRNSLHILNKNGLSPVTYDARQVYAQALLYHRGKIFIGTVNNGLLVYHNGKITKLSIDEGLLSNSILGLRKNGDRLFIVSSGAVQLFDMSRSTFFSSKNLSIVENVLTADLTMVNDESYLATLDGFFAIRDLQASSPEKIVNYLSPVKVNNRHTEGISKFEADNNNLQFKIDVPLYYKARQTYIRYSLITDKDSSWNVTAPGERTVTFASLMPGKYTFKAHAVNPELGYAKEPVIYRFEILHSWWQDEIFQTIVTILILGFIGHILVNYHINRRTFERILFQQQQSINQERQRISSEIHDDIGAGIFAIKLFADVARDSRNSKNDILHISLMINDMSQKIREIIWSTNVENDNLEDLILYIKFQMTKLFEHSEIEFELGIPNFIPDFPVSGENRKNMFLLIKEFLHNAIKHANASKVTLNIAVEGKYLHIYIDDNGTGFNLNSMSENAMGLKNANKRIERLKAEYKLITEDGTHIEIIIPLA